MQWASLRADASIGVCRALVDVLGGWQVPSDRLHVMRNGVDLTRFRPIGQKQAREELQIDGSPLLVSVGYLVERKGHHIAVEALAALKSTYPNARLFIIGEGPERESLTQLSRKLGVQDQVTLVGALPNTDLFRWYGAADALILASSREGWANVLLEAMACGTPVVASSIWGTPEVVATDAVGRLVAERTGAAFADAIRSLIAAGPDREVVRQYAENFSWQATTDAQLALFQQIMAQQGAARA